MRFRALPLIVAVAAVAAGESSADELCFVPSQAYGFNITVDCNTNAGDHDWIGYRITSGEPCQDVEGGAPCQYELNQGGRPYGWTISNSSTDPDENSGPLAPETPLYLWYLCDNEYGMSAAEFRLEGLEILSFEPLQGFVNIYELPDFGLIAPDCVYAPLVVGVLTVETPVSVDDTGWGRIKGLYR